MMMSACTACGAQNGVERASKRRNISIRNEITDFFEIEERLSFASCWACFEDEIGVHCVRRLEWSVKSVKTPKYLNQERNNSFLRNRGKIEFCELHGSFR
jgi:translation initiation factor 2 beta subunit (eIF-2beta)/eIF-5